MYITLTCISKIIRSPQLCRLLNSTKNRTSGSCRTNILYGGRCGVLAFAIEKFDWPIGSPSLLIGRIILKCALNKRIYTDVDWILEGLDNFSWQTVVAMVMNKYGREFLDWIKDSTFLNMYTTTWSWVTIHCGSY